MASNPPLASKLWASPRALALALAIALGYAPVASAQTIPAPILNLRNAYAPTPLNNFPFNLSTRFGNWHDAVADSQFVNDAVSYPDGVMVAGSALFSSASAIG